MVSNKGSGPIGKKIEFRCPKCGAFAEHIVDEKDIEDIEVSGLANFLVDHGDHMLLIYFDMDGKVRSWQLYEEGNYDWLEHVVRWERKNKWKRRTGGVGLIVAETETWTFSDIYWEGDDVWPLNHLKKFNKDYFKLRKGDEKVIVFNHYPLYYVVKGLDPPLAKVEKLYKFFKEITKELKRDVVAEPAVQRVIVAVLKNVDRPFITVEALELIKDIASFGKISIRRDLLEYMIQRDEEVRDLSEQFPFIKKIPENGEILIRDVVEALDLENIVKLLRLYFKLKKLNIVRLVSLL